MEYLGWAGLEPKAEKRGWENRPFLAVDAEVIWSGRSYPVPGIPGIICGMTSMHMPHIWICVAGRQHAVLWEWNQMTGRSYENEQFGQTEQKFRLAGSRLPYETSKIKITHLQNPKTPRIYHEIFFASGENGPISERTPPSARGPVPSPRSVITHEM